MAHAETASGTLRTVRNAAGLRDILGSRQPPAGARTPARSWDRWLMAAIYSHLNHANIRLRLWDGTSCGPIPPEITRGTLKKRAANTRRSGGDHHDSRSRRAVQPGLAARHRVRRRLRLGTHRRRRRPRRAARSAVPRQAGRRGPSPATPGCAACSARRMRSIDPATTSIATTTSATPSTGCGSIASWCTRAPTSRRRTATLEEAQLAKMEHVCRKLRLRPGERVVEAGCGWGALALLHGVALRRPRAGLQHLARADRVCARARVAPRVCAIGWNSSKTTIATSRAGTTRSCRSACSSTWAADYSGRSAGMIDRVLDRHGRGLLHFIGRNQPAPLHPWIRTAHLSRRVSADAARGVESVFEPAG